MPTTAEFLPRLRGFCQALPESEEYLMHGHPSFRVGKKPYVIVGDGELAGYPPTFSVKVALMDQPLYLEDPRITRTHYIGQHGWITLDLTQPYSWDEIERLTMISYRGVATKRALRALEAR